MKDFLSLKDLNPDLWKQLLRVSAEVKNHPGHFRQMLVGKSSVLVFEKSSLRTRLTFELGMKQLGGDAVYLDYQESRLGGRESLSDVARNLERWFDCIVARTFSHEAVVQLAEYASVPVINGLSDEEHPCQALADAFTLVEKWGELEGKTLAFVGDGNNVCVSLIHAALLSGMSFVAITPHSHQPDPEAVRDFERFSSSSSSARYQWTESLQGLRGADVVYTDTWVSMGQEDETRERVRIFQAYQVTPEVMASTGKDSYFMHCLPAHRNQEVTDSVIDSPQSLVFEQAENRLHVQKALLLFLLAPKELDRYFQLGRLAAWKS
ncbi:ornithine carbamoyltransferase [Acidobacteria bacterium AH-259-O06]|nr:ornithine carbamoyltransferase [Acidobacteria bacterium AH-259-O06]